MYTKYSVYMYLLQVLEAKRRMYSDTPASGQRGVRRETKW